jgi:hypothetical protein
MWSHHLSFPVHNRFLLISTFTPFDEAPKKYMNSGLRQDVLVKKATVAKALEPIDPLQSGGLDDEDAHATRPSFKPPTTCRSHQDLSDGDERDSKRQNNVRGTL